MKDSGIEWIGKIPKDWDFEKGKYHFSNKKIIPGVSSYKYQRLALTLKGVIKRDKDDSDGLQPKDFNTYQLLKKDELVFKLIDLQNVSTSRVGLAHDTGLVSPAYIILHSKEDIFPRYIEKFYLSMWYREIFNALGDDGVRSSLTTTQLLNVLVPIPSLSEQQKIATFLDKKCSQIDSLRSDIEKQIEILEEYKKSIITEAVTKGLDTNIEMKDSGIEWIGKIPKDWEIIPFKYVLYERTEKNNPIQSTERLSLSIDAGVTLYSEKTTNLDRFKENFAAYKLAHKGDLVMNSMNMIVGATGVSKYYGCVSPAYYTFYDNTKDNLYTRYCEYIFKCRPMLRVLHSLGKGIYSIERGDDRVNTCRLKVSRYDLNKIEIPIPPVDIVYNILNYLDNKCSQTDSIIFVKKQQLESLDNYKKSLIYEYVTGKKEVSYE